MNEFTRAFPAQPPVVDAAQYLRDAATYFDEQAVLAEQHARDDMAWASGMRHRAHVLRELADERDHSAPAVPDRAADDQTPPAPAPEVPLLAPRPPSTPAGGGLAEPVLLQPDPVQEQPSPTAPDPGAPPTGHVPGPALLPPNPATELVVKHDEPRGDDVTAALRETASSASAALRMMP